MKTPIYAAITLGLSAVAANAGGLDRSGQWVNDIFQTGSVAKLSYSSTNPKLSGTCDRKRICWQTFSVASGSYKTDLNEQVSVAVIWDQPFGASITYDTPAQQVSGRHNSTIVVAMQSRLSLGTSLTAVSVSMAAFVPKLLRGNTWLHTVLHRIAST